MKLQNNKIFIIPAALGLIIGAGLWALMPVIVPLPKDIFDLSSVVSTRLTDSKGRLLHEYLSSDRERLHWVKLAKISPDLLRTIVFKEDRRFYLHPGIDPIAIIRAAASNLRAGSIVSGASTITMQLARNFFGNRVRTFKNKIKEALLAFRLERELTKDEILLQYVNRIPFGNQARGVERASQLYFHKPAFNLSLAESAFLSVIPRSPTDLNPYRNRMKVIDRAHVLLSKMAEKRIITKEEEVMALAEPIRIRKKQTPFRAPHLDQFLSRKDWGVKLSSIVTTIDLDLQHEAEAALTAELALLKEHHVQNGAIIVLENASGNVLAFVGSANFADNRILGQNNGCIALRQPGSTLKPFTYALALESGMTLSTLVADVEAHFPAATGSYSPKNFNNRFYGPVRLREALANSLNVSAVKVAQQVGAPRILELLRNAGFTSLHEDAEYYGLGLTLGNGEVSLLELAAAYATIARGGLTVWPVLVKKLIDETGRAIKLPAPLPGKRIMQPETAYLISDALSDINARMASFGVLSPLNFPYRVAAKTGTSRNFTDNWTVGYTKEITVAVWVGNFDATPMAGISGITGAGPVFNRVMSVAMEGRDTTWQKPSESITRAKVCALSGDLAAKPCTGTIEELFVKGTEPENSCAFHRTVSLDFRNNLLAHNLIPVRFRKETSFAIFPTPYAEWAKAEGVPVPPTDYSPLNAEEITLTAKRLKIKYPDTGQTYIMDPFIPVNYQTILPRIDSDEPLATIEMIVNGKILGRSPVIEPTRIPISPGQHRVIVRDPASKVLSREVVFNVATPEEKGYYW